ncbi:MAG: endonuclease/exonuclease/phosphatase family protein [Myxococcales bacterium]|nr:endonuclease/exonuclease/phosphatase family protein [Myxococcales bacterium]MCB9535701.1 endonuclease/exonuclease/phosphatase family protein [Myxococcales bacterium]
MTTILFWNVNKKVAATALLPDLVREYGVNLVILAEEPNEGDDPSLAWAHAVGFDPVRSHVPSKLACYADAPRWEARYTNDAQRLFILERLGAPALSVGAVHLPSKAFFDVHDIQAEAARTAAEVRAHEQGRHDRTLLIGDFNMAPFEPGMTLARGFNAVMDARIARRGERTVQGLSYPLFYNPMWSFLGDRTIGPPGSHFHDASGHHLNHFWHMIDQVLVRPSLMEALVDVRLVDRIGDRSLADVEDGRPCASDHFPLLCTLSEGEDS